MSSLKPGEKDLVVAREQGGAGPVPGAPSVKREVLAGRYAVESRIGAGGMGVVLLAIDLKTDNFVALKRVHASLAERKQVVERLLRGARTARSFSGRHVARVLDSGLLEGGVPFVVTDYLEGCDFTSYLKRRGPLRVKEAVKYLLQICEAVAEGHAAGVLHRDLKPENIFLCLASEGSPGVKVLDFGTSTVACGVESEGQNAATGAMRSSLLTMAPEQMRSAGGIDERADIWSIGAVGYTLVCGVGPFEARTELEICAKVLGEPPAPIPAHAELGGLDRVLLRCLDKEPEQRFANVSELALALARHGGDGALNAAERVWELLMADETVRMEKPVLDGVLPDSASLFNNAPAESGPDTVPAALPGLWSDAPGSVFDEAPDDPGAPGGVVHSDDTLVSRYPDDTSLAEGRRRSRTSIPQVVLMAAPEQQRSQTGAATGTDRAAFVDNEVTRRISTSPAPRGGLPIAPREQAAAAPQAGWRRVVEVLLVVTLCSGLFVVWLVRGRVIDIGDRARIARTGVTGCAITTMRVLVVARRAGDKRVGVRPPDAREPLPAASAAGLASGRPPLVPPPGGWRYEELPPESIYDEVERERRRLGQ